MAKDEKLKWNVVQFVLSCIMALGIFEHQAFYAFPPNFTLTSFSWLGAGFLAIMLFVWFKVMEFAEEHND